MPLACHFPDTLVWECRWDAISQTNVFGNAVGTGTPFPGNSVGTPFPRHIGLGSPLGRHFPDKCVWAVGTPFPTHIGLGIPLGRHFPDKCVWECRLGLGRHFPDTLVRECRWDAISKTQLSGNAVGTHNKTFLGFPGKAVGRGPSWEHFPGT